MTLKGAMKRLLFSLVIFWGVLGFFDLLAAEEAKEKPRCASDKDCQKPGMRGVCQNPGQATASCIFQEVVTIDSIVIVPPGCRTCHAQDVANSLQGIFPGMNAKYLEANDPQAKKLIRDLKIEMLPAYIFSRQFEKDPNFLQFRGIADLVNDHYYLKPSFAGVSYFVDRKMERGKLNLFLLLTQKDALPVLKVAKELIDKKKDKIKFQINLVGRYDPETNVFLIPGGRREVNEERIYACVEQSHPQKVWDYLFCRLADIDSLWWEDCLRENAIPPQEIKECARGPEADQLIKEKIKLAEELRISAAPLFLLDNVEIFGATERSTSDEIIGIIDSKGNNIKKKKE